VHIFKQISTQIFKQIFKDAASLTGVRFAAFVLSFFLVMACNKQPDGIGTDIQPESDRLTFHYDTTLTINAYAAREDSLRSDETSQGLLGSYWDPMFGITRAAIFTQLRLSTTGHSFGTAPQIDSIVLSLAFNGLYGDSSSLQTISVRELSSPLHVDSAYYTNQITPHGTTLLGTRTFIAKPTDSVNIDTVRYAPHFRMAITDEAFKQKILAAGTDNLSSNDKFTAYINGIMIDAAAAAAPGIGSVMFINMDSPLTFMMVYYHNSTDTTSFQLNIDGYCARYNYFDHNDYLEADPLIRQQVVDKDTALGADRLYVQAMGGIRTVLSFDPGMISEMRGKGYAVNEARLVVTNLDKSSKYNPPASLVLVQVESDNTITYLDDQYEGEAYFGGSYKSDGTYSFRISHYVQDLLNGNIDPATRLTFFATGAAVKSNRLIFNGTNPTDASLKNSRLQVQVLFTKIP